MGNSGMDPVKLLKIAQEAEEFGRLNALAKEQSGGGQKQWSSKPEKIEGLKRSHSATQPAPKAFQYGYGL